MHDTFAHLLTQHREGQLLSMSELARRSGMSKSAISMLESGRRQPGLDSIRKLEKGLALEGDGQQLFRDTALAARRVPTSTPETAIPDRETFQKMFIDALKEPMSKEEVAALKKMAAEAQNAPFPAVHKREREDSFLPTQ